MILRGAMFLAGVVITAFCPALALAEILIATIGPMTGAYASIGEQMRRGAEMAVTDLNAKGGVLGQELRLWIGDDACEPDRAVAVAGDAVAAGVVFVAGHFCSGASIPASKVYEQAGVLQISPGSTNPALTEEGGDNVFRMCGRDDQQGVVAGNFLAEHYSRRRIAILHDQTAYGKGLADVTKAQLNKRGVTEVLYQAYVAKQQDYSSLMAEMKTAAIDVFYVGGYHTEAAIMIRQAHEMGYRPQLMSGDALVTEAYWKLAGDAAEGTLMTFGPDPRKNPLAGPVVARFRTKLRYEPEGYTLYTYGAIQVWAQAVERAGAAEVDKVVLELRTGRFDTVLGQIGFDKKGDVSAPGYVLYEWSEGQYDYARAM
jgi:branched-chain amino acid transport system substrate-binding protein